MQLKYIFSNDDIKDNFSSGNPYYIVESDSIPEIGEGIFFKSDFVGFVTAKYRIIDSDEVQIIVRPKANLDKEADGG